MAAGPTQESSTPATFISSFPRAFFGSSSTAQMDEAPAPASTAAGAAARAAADTQRSASPIGTYGTAPTVAVGVAHTLEWHVAAYTVPWKKQTKDILSNVGAWPS